MEGLFRGDPAKGTSVLQASAADPQNQQQTLVVGALAGLAGGLQGSAFESLAPSARATVLGSLLRLAYQFVPPSDDLHHRDVYSPVFEIWHNGREGFC